MRRTGVGEVRWAGAVGGCQVDTRPVQASVLMIRSSLLIEFGSVV